MTIEPDGSVTVRSGTSPHGQGHETAWAQIAAEQLGVPMDDVTVLHGDTDECPRGIGTFGSRSAPVGGSAIFNNAETVRERARELAAHLLEAAVEDIRFEAGQYFVAGSPARAVGWSEIAAYAYAPDAPEDAAGALTADVDFKPPAETFPFGAHLCAVEIDPDTGAVEIRRYISVDDCGRVINPLLAEGQVHGGLAQGIAQALYEEAVYDADGNLLTPSLLEYAVPRADMLPSYELHRTVTPTPVNPARSQGDRRGGDHRLDAGGRQRRDGRAPPLRGGTPGYTADPGEGLARDAGLSAEARGLPVTTKTLTLTQRAQLDFWTGFHGYAKSRAGRIRPIAPQPDTWMDMAIGRDGFRLVAVAATWNLDHLPEPEIRASLAVFPRNAGTALRTAQEGTGTPSTRSAARSWTGSPSPVRISAPSTCGEQWTGAVKTPAKTATGGWSRSWTGSTRCSSPASCASREPERWETRPWPDGWDRGRQSARHSPGGVVEAPGSAVLPERDPGNHGASRISGR